VIDTKYDADVLIVGGGPSGSICAYYLAKAGIKVILIDSENFPRDKICGDFVSPVGLNELKKIGIWELDDFKKTNVINQATVYVDGVKLVTSKLPHIDGLPNYGRVIPRVILDNWILDAAREQGVQIITPCKFENYFVSDKCVKINCLIDGIEVHFTTKIIVGADGSTSRVERIMNGHKRKPEKRIVAVRAYFENIDCNTEDAELFFSSKSFPGYYWFFPTSANTANVGIGMMLENFPKEKIRLKQLLLDMIENDKAFKARIGKGKIADKIVGFPLSIYDPKATIIKDRVLLAGDAAGLIHSINGEGMQYAMQSGRWAAESIIECSSSADFSTDSLKNYEKKVQVEIGYDMCIANMGMQLIRNRNLNPLWLKLFSIIGTQSKYDAKYADIAGGILAGMVPSNKVLSFYFICKTLYRGLRTPFKGTFGIFKFMKKTLIFSAVSFYQAIKQRKEYQSWVNNIIQSVFATVWLYRIRQNETKNNLKKIQSKKSRYDKVLLTNIITTN